MSSVKAKFRCSSIIDTTFPGGMAQREVQLNAIYGTAGENVDFSKATPGGRVSMIIDKETKAYDSFQPGKDYYLTFEEARE